MTDWDVKRTDIPARKGLFIMGLQSMLQRTQHFFMQV